MQGIASLARHGRFEDNRIAHVADGETVIPLAVLEANPLLKGAIFHAMRKMDLDPERYIVGHTHNSINPVTGQPEFFLGGIFGGVKGLFKSAAPVLGAIAGSFIPGLGPAIGPALGAFAGSKLAGNSTKSALLAGGIAGLGGYMLGGSEAARAGGFQKGDGFLGIGGSGPSLGSALWSGVGQTGIGGLFQGAQTPAAGVGVGGAAPAPAGVGANAPASPVPQGATGAAGSVTQAAAPQTHAATVASAINSPMTKDLMSKGLSAEQALKVQGLSLTPEKTGGGGIMGFAKNNPMLTAGLIGGGMYLLNSMEEKPTNPAQQAWRGPTSRQLMDQNPSRYKFDTRNFMADGGAVVSYEGGGHVEGPGGPKDDKVPAMLSDGEFVMTAKAVEGLGLGDRLKGAREMYKMMKSLEARA